MCAREQAREHVGVEQAGQVYFRGEAQRAQAVEEEAEANAGPEAEVRDEVDGRATGSGIGRAEEGAGPGTEGRKDGRAGREGCDKADIAWLTPPKAET